MKVRTLNFYPGMAIAILLWYRSSSISKKKHAILKDVVEDY